MRFGICGNLDVIPIVREAGYDYVELPLASTLQPESDGGDEPVRMVMAVLERHGIGVEAFNILLPPGLPCVGPDVDAARLERYFGAGIERAARAGGRVVVFGSGGQRRIPEGFPVETARRQFRQAVRLAGDAARRHGVTIAIEPLNRTETNLVNSVPEALEIARELDHPSVRVLSDLYHMQMENQPFAETLEAGAMLAHVHVAGAGRRAPVVEDIPALTEYFRAVKAAGYDAYDARVSIEARWEDTAREAGTALAVLRSAWASATTTT